MRYSKIDLATRTHKGIWWCILMCTTIISCTTKSPLHPTYKEFIQHGFYLYILPETEVTAYSWIQQTYIYSWDHHCLPGSDASSHPNPILVSYYNPDQEGQPGFSIQLGPWSIAWDYREPTTEVRLKTSYAEDGIANYYVSGEYVALKFTDKFGVPIQIHSDLPLTNVISLTNQLEYVGPSTNEVTNPWSFDKCEKH